MNNTNERVLGMVKLWMSIVSLGVGLSVSLSLLSLLFKMSVRQHYKRMDIMQYNGGLQRMASFLTTSFVLVPVPVGILDCTFVRSCFTVLNVGHCFKISVKDNPTTTAFVSAIV